MHLSSKRLPIKKSKEIYQFLKQCEKYKGVQNLICLVYMNMGTKNGNIHSNWISIPAFPLYTNQMKLCQIFLKMKYFYIHEQ